ncbi:MAG: tetratricopeptide repeat protein [Elusimicrobia bacterium]|nr:tetratricopeptide repeat protein [Elusimicrobiota bacterium]
MTSRRLRAILERAGTGRAENGCARRALLLACWLVGAWSAAPARALGIPGWRSGEIQQVERLFEERRYDEVIAKLSGEGLNRLRFSGGLSRAYLYLGVSYERTRQFDKAVGVYQLGARLFPRNVDALTRLASLLHAMQLDEAARPLFEKVLRINPRHPAALVGLAEIERSLGFLDRSVGFYERALEARDKDASLYRTYAEVLYDRRDFRAAETAIRWSLTLQTSPESLLVLAYIRRSRGFGMEAVDIVRQMEDAALPEDALRYALLAAVWHMEAGQWHNAWSQAGLVLKAHPDDPLARYVRARAHLQTGRRDLSMKDLEVSAAGRAPFVAKASAALLDELKKEP